ncbi:MAG: HK97 gp10 family phage protein [Actinophytocola sp.]|uniref:HK97 gp10 family phage protein n=1 Tax=Actinophytocola sp. TaxID=1872138 RepID=UPI003C70B0D8
MASIRVTVFADEAVRLAREASVNERAEIARQAADDARATARVETGEFKSGIGVVVDGTLVRIVNDDPEAGFKEYGTSDTAPQATMTNAARRYGKYSGVQPKGR